jgi:hypothetical protein
MDNNTFTVNASETSCSRCGDVKSLNRFGVCDQCDTEIDNEYLEIYNIQNMEC